MELQNIFFLTFPVGLESIGEEELILKWPLFFNNSNYKIVNRVMGGLEIECSLIDGFKLNHILKCPSRILLRLTSFKCRDVPKLFQRTSKFRWSSYLLSTTPKLHISAAESRLFDSRKIEKAFYDGVTEFFRHQPMKKKYQELQSQVAFAPEIFIRFDNDTCTFSLDTTGELLHKRGEKLLTGHAPIRESLASLLLMSLAGDNTATLLDPMCGSGTFLIEAYDFFRPNNTREFSYQNTPYFRELKQLPTTLPNLNNKLFSGFKGLDIDPNIIDEAIINKKSREIEFSVQDVFNDTKVVDENIIAILNPPYGKRVGNKNEIDINYYLKIIRSIHNKYKTKRIGIIIPSEFPLKSSKELKVAQAIPFKNGGLSVIFYILDL